MHVRVEAIRPPAPFAAVVRAAAALRPRIDLPAAFFGALAAGGLLLLVSLGAAMLAVLIGMSTLGAGIIGSALTGATLTSSLLMAAVLAVLVLLPFAVGGYVGTRLATVHPWAQAVVVWAWAALPAVLGLLAALIAGGPARHAVTFVIDDPASALLVVSALALSLLGALLGADAAHRRRSTAVR